MRILPYSLGLLSLLLVLGAPPRARGGDRPERIDLLVRGGTVVTMDAKGHILEHGAVAVRGGKIIAVGTAPDVAVKYEADRTIDATDRVVMPGLINTHTHAPMVLFRGLADDLPLMDWLQKHIFPAEARNVDEDFVRWGTRLACLEMIQGGTTTFVDMYYFEDAIADETARAGMRGVLGQAILDFPVPDNKTWADAMAACEKYVRRWKGHTLVTPAIAPHAPVHRVSGAPQGGPCFLQQARGAAGHPRRGDRGGGEDAPREVRGDSGGPPRRTGRPG